MASAVITSIVRRDRSDSPPEPLSPKDSAFAERAIDALNRALDHPAFLPSIRAATYSSALWLSPVNTLKTVTGEEVARIIVAGGSNSSSSSAAIGLTIELTKLRAGIRGFTETRDTLNTIDSGFFDDCVARDDPEALAALWMHEWMHSAGFQHRGRTGEQSDVACTIERLVRELSGAARR